MNFKYKKEKEILTDVPGIGSRVINNELTFAIRKWKNQLTESNIIDDLRENRYYMKPSMKKRKMIKNAIFLQKLNKNV